MKEIKHFQSHEASVEIAELKIQAKKLLAIKNLVQELTGNKTIKSLAELQFWIQIETKFDSPRFGADSMDILDGYQNVVKLDSEVTITAEQVTPMYDLKPAFIEAIKEKYTTYFTAQELKERKTFRRISKEFNSLPVELRQGAVVNRQFNFIHYKIQ